MKTEDGFLIDMTSMDIFAEPYLAAGPFLTANIRSTGSSIVGEAAEIEATVVLKSPLFLGSQFFIRLPTSVFYIQESG